MITVQQVQDKAREFIGTPFKDQHRVKGQKGGIDCVGLVLLTAEELGISYADTKEMRGSDYLNYRATSLNSFVLTECRKRLIEKPVSKIVAGDVVVMKCPDIPCHCGIISERKGVLYLIHALNSGEMKVVEHILDLNWRKKICGAFSYPGVVGGVSSLE